MKPSKKNGPEEHPLFRAMVVMGGSLAVGCGATAATGESKSGPHSGSGAGGKEAAEPNDEAGGSGDVLVMGTGGSNPVATAAGGTNNAGAGGAAAANECPPEQWDCGTLFVECGSGPGSDYTLPSGCSCAPSKPKAPSDCPPGKAFTCRHAGVDASGQPIDQAFDCSCVVAGATCSETCKNALSMGASGYQCTEPPDPSAGVLCGCAFVILR
jgi:hypothetical protein